AIARITVTQAYDQLQAEGYVERRSGAGTYVSSALLSPFQEFEENSPDKTVPRLTAWGQRVTKLGRSGGRREEGQPQEGEIDFGFGRSFPHIFPYDVWRSLLARYLSTDDVMLSRYGSAAGFQPLREAIAYYLGR